MGGMQEHLFDDLARGLDEGAIARDQALKWMGRVWWLWP